MANGKFSNGKRSNLKPVALLLAIALLVGTAVGGTLAWLTDNSGPVKNTFTVGSVAITLDEALTDLYGVPVSGADRIPNATHTDGNTYKLIPGHTYTKDPKITVSSDSENCWVFVKLENGLNDTATFNIDNSKWTIVATYTDHSKVYAYNTVLKAGDDATLFTEFTFAQSADPETYKSAAIKVTGYAVQADGFGSAEAAWAASGFGG